jgi:hypothetical protein
VNWGNTSVWHEMTLFQNSTTSRFFAIWGYFKGSGPARVKVTEPIKDAKGEAYIFEGNYCKELQYLLYLFSISLISKLYSYRVKKAIKRWYITLLWSSVDIAIIICYNLSVR